MQMLYGYDVAADLAPQTPLRRGGQGARRRRRDGHRPRARSARPSTAPSPPDVPYLVNVITDVDAAYPRTTFGI